MLPTIRCATRWVLPSLLPLSLVHAQEWTFASDSLRMQATPITHDADRGRSIAVTLQGQTFEHDGRDWLRTARLPGAHQPLAVAYQAHRGRVLGACLDVSVGWPPQFRTFEYDGFEWRHRTPDHEPPARFQTHLAYDSARQRVVLFGGSGMFDDTWEWDGRDWLRRLPGVRPPARSEAGFAYDAGRGVTVLLGGRDSGSVLGDHWEWNGTTWTRFLGSVPPPRSHTQLAYDHSRARLVAYGGFPGTPSTPFFQPQPWEFDGQSWSQRAVSGAPLGRFDHTMVSVPGGVRVFGGRGGPLEPELRFDIFDYDGAQFVARGRPHAASTTTARESLSGDLMVLSQVDGAALLQRWDGTELKTEPVVGVLPARNQSAMAAGPGGSLLVFGGYQGLSVALGDTWRLQAGQWQQMQVPGPSPRYGHAMASDPVRGKVVLFGGTNSSGVVHADLWEWDGSAWNLQQPAGAVPGAMAYAGMAFDPSVGRVVLHGTPVQGFQAETWEWDGSGWSLVEAELPPTDLAALTWAPSLGAMLLVRSQILVGATVAFGLQRGTGWIALPHTPLGPVSPGTLGVDRYDSLVVLGGDDRRSVQLASVTAPYLLRSVRGCSAVSPAPRVVSHDLPRAGRDVRLELLGAAPAQLAALYVGSPFGTQRIGGCSSVLLEPQVLQLALTNGVGQLQHTLVVPNAPVLVGYALSAQALSMELQGPVFAAFAVSDALFLNIGR